MSRVRIKSRWDLWRLTLVGQIPILIILFFFKLYGNQISSPEGDANKPFSSLVTITRPFLGSHLAHRSSFTWPCLQVRSSSAPIGQHRGTCRTRREKAKNRLSVVRRPGWGVGRRPLWFTSNWRTWRPFLFPTPYICRVGLLSGWCRVVWTRHEMN